MAAQWWWCRLKTTVAVSDWASEGNRNPEVGDVPSKIRSVLAYVVSAAVWICICMEVTSVAINGGGRSQDSVSVNNGQLEGGGAGVLSFHQSWLYL